MRYFKILGFLSASALTSTILKKSKDILKSVKTYHAALTLFHSLLFNLILTNFAFASPPIGDRVISVAGPDVWGYDLRDHELIPPGYKRSGLAYLAPDGDVVFKLRRCVEHCNDIHRAKYEYAMLWFLAGKLEFTLDDPVTLDYSEKYQLKFDDEDRVDLLNGECIKAIHLPTGKLCQINYLAESLFIKGKCSVLDNEYLSKYDIEANRVPGIKRYSIMGAMNNIYRYMEQADGMCDRGGPGGGELIYQQLYPIKSVVGLRDGTFIASRGDLLIRFDKDFNTKFIHKHNIELAFQKVIKGNFFVLPYEKVKELDDKVAINKDHAVQGLHDELLLYLLRREENN